MKDLRFTKDPSRIIWGLVITLVVILALMAMLVSCQPTGYEPNTPIPAPITVDIQSSDNWVTWDVPRQVLTRTYDEEFNIVCYTYTDFNDFGMLRCFEVTE